MNDKSQIIDQLLANLPTYDPPGPDEFTLNDLLDSKGWARNDAHRKCAVRLLKQMINDGCITARKGNVDGNRSNIYKPVKK